MLRAHNDRLTLDLIFDRGPISKTEVGAGTRISKPTVGHSLRRLTELGLVTESGTRVGGVGRAPTLFEVDPRVGSMIMVEVGPELVHGIGVTIAGQYTPEAQVQPGGRDIVEVIRELRDQVVAGLPETTFGHTLVLGLSGAYDAIADHVRHGAHMVPRVGGLERPGLGARLREAFGPVVAVENDVNLVALAEHTEGVTAGTATSVLFWADTGVGAASIINGRIHRGATGSAGEMAFLPVARAERTPDDGEGGFQRWAGGVALAALGEKLGLSGRTRQMIAAAVADTAQYGLFLDAIAERYAQAIGSLIAVLDPDVVALSGAYAIVGGEELADRIRTAVDAQAIRSVPVRLGAFTESPVLAGAEVLARRLHREALLNRVGSAT
ncbi:ROK family protein [Microbacterium sp. ARD32]|uniref:ROK family protein n=1 Tax=Microbacterium sp. ARD32 TaxID=2962577 RepID=UPI0028828D68|nr:ROK family protein [Microbacterium sp. ARD32]MDT0156661.1 ROK family protein [Microbacterium sp. ARD32]